MLVFASLDERVTVGYSLACQVVPVLYSWGVQTVSKKGSRYLINLHNPAYLRLALFFFFLVEQDIDHSLP